MPKGTFRRMAENLFLLLRKSDANAREGTVLVHYPERFGAGRAVLGVSLPLAGLPLRTGLKQLRALAATEYPPVVDGDRRTLTLFISCPHVGQELSAILRAATQNGEWAKKRFGFRRALLVPSGPRMTMLNRLGALSPG